MSIELKIKAKHLAAEAKIIRAEERKAKESGDTAQLQSLHDHRLHTVRPAARSTHLARAFIKGVPYKVVEQTCRTQPYAAEIRKMVSQYGSPEFRAKAAAEQNIKILKWIHG